MKNWTIILAIALTGCAVEQEPTLQDTFGAINTEVLQNGQGYNTLKDAVETIGHRLTGSENGTKAEQYAYDLFNAYGLATEFFEFEAESWARDSVSLNIIAASDTLSLPVVALAHSPVLADVNAPLIDVRDGLREDFDANKEALKGKIAVMNIGIFPKDSTRSNLHRSEKTALAMEYGAAGVVIINRVEGGVLLTGTASVTGSLIDIPAVCIGFEDGRRLVELMDQQEVQGQLYTTNQSGNIKARNVIATIPGTDKPDEWVVIGGHLDSWDLATGAIDNGVGSFTVMDIARAFSALGLKTSRTMKFVMFMGEEQGLLGSKAWVEHLKETGDIEKVRYLINLDMSGNTNGFNIFGRDEMQLLADSVCATAARVDTTFKGKVRNSVGLHSDHLPFLLEGIPILGNVGSLGGEVYKYYHSDGDHFDLVNREHMDRCTRFHAMMLYALATFQDIPAVKYTDEQARQYFLDHNLKEELVLGNDWKWED